VWSAGDGIGAAMEILTDALALAIMYGAAAFGWMLFVLLPPAVWAVQKVVAERRVTELRADQQRLIEQWGEKISGSSGPPPAKREKRTPDRAGPGSLSQGTRTRSPDQHAIRCSITALRTDLCSFSNARTSI
jgi:hypothetical protein